MRVEYRLFTPDGDIPVDPQILALPFKITPFTAHPFLTLGDYFEAIETFLLRHNGRSLESALHQALHTSIRVAPIDTLLIRSEKHGAFYHVASIEMTRPEERIKLAVSTALSPAARACLHREYHLLQSLGRSHPLPYLPAAYALGQVDREKKEGRQSLLMVLTEWFEAFHEWHTTFDSTDGCRKIRIWDGGNHPPYLSQEDAFQLFREAAKILTLYYDPKTYRQIYPWHHAAGDFVVSTRAHAMQVRLATVRKYESVMTAFTPGPVNPLIAMVYFLLNLTIRMRLDRMDGVGDTVWAEDFAVEATLQGFLEALYIMQQERRFTLCGVNELLSLLRSFRLSELETLFESLCGLYADQDPEEYGLIQSRLRPHVKRLHQALQEYPR